MENQRICPKCGGAKHVKSGVVNQRQRFRCKACNYNFTVEKVGKKIDDYYVIKALQLYVEGVSYREIERLLGVSHVTVLNWVKQYRIKRPSNTEYHPTYKIMTHEEMIKHLSSRDRIKEAGWIITELGDKFMVIRWDRFKK